MESGLKRPRGNELCRRLHPNDSRNPFSFTVAPQGVMVWGRGTASAVDRVLSLMAHLRRSSSLFFIPLVPYPARSARHLPHAGKALFRKYRYPHPTSAPSGHLLPEEGECRLPYSKAFFPVLSFRAKARNLFRLRWIRKSEESRQRETPCSMRLGSRCFMQRALRRKTEMGNEKDPSAALGMTKRERHIFPFLFIPQREPTSAPSGHLLPEEGGRRSWEAFSYEGDRGSPLPNQKSVSDRIRFFDWA